MNLIKSKLSPKPLSESLLMRRQEYLPKSIGRLGTADPFRIIPNAAESFLNINLGTPRNRRRSKVIIPLIENYSTLIGEISHLSIERTVSNDSVGGWCN